WIYRHDVVDVQELRIALDEHLEVQRRSPGDVRAAVAQGIRLLLIDERERRAHSLPGRRVPGLVLGIDPGLAPEPFLQLVSPRVVIATDPRFAAARDSLE